MPGRAELALHVYLLVLASLALGFLDPPCFGAGTPWPPRRPSISAFACASRDDVGLPELARLEREVTLSTTTAFDLHFRLRPVLRRISARMLLSRRGIELERQPDAARTLLGEELWELVRPDREPPRDRAAPGLELSSLRTMVDALEAL